MQTATVPSNVDLDQVINIRRSELEKLVDLKQQRDTITGQITLILTGKPANGAVVQQMRQIDSAPRRGPRNTNEKTLGDLLYEHLVTKIREDKEYRVTTRDAANIAEEAGYRTSSENFFNTVRQLLVTDPRFKRYKIKGSRNVNFGIRDH